MTDPDSFKRIEEQLLKELEQLGELPPIAIQATTHMLSQHSKLMSHHAKEIHSLLADPDEDFSPWGCVDSYSYDIHEYGSKAIEKSMKEDPVHELTQLRRQMKEVTNELRDLKKRLINEDNSFSSTNEHIEKELKKIKKG